MGLLDAVNDFVDSETPDADKMNLLRDTLIALLDGTGLPSSALSWPLVAGGIVDMNGFSLQNVGSLYNVIHVNASTSLAEAVSAVNAAAGGTIIIDPGYTADTTSSGLGVTADNVTITGMGNNSTLHISDRSAAGAGLTFSGDNATLTNLTVTCEAAPSNLDSLILLDKGVNASVLGCLFTSPEAISVYVGETSVCRQFEISGNRFIGHSEAGIFLNNAEYGTVHSNVMNDGTGENITISSNAAYNVRYISFTGNVIRDGTNGFYSTAANFGPARAYQSFTGNVVSCTLPFYIGKVSSSNIVGNMFYGNVSLLLKDGAFANNSCFGTLTLSECDNACISGNFVDGLFNNLGTGTLARVDGNHFVDTQTIPATTGIATFTNNVCEGAFNNLTTSDVELYANNYAAGGIS